MSVDLFAMNCPNCGRSTNSGLIYECQFCGGVLCREGGPGRRTAGCALNDDSTCPHCGKPAGYGDNCFDLREVRKKHGMSK